jgi:uncharacterized protein (DUF1501 family)
MHDMHLLQPDLHTRRAFLRRSSRLALAGTAMPFALNLAAMGEAAAFEASDYKALVCLFMSGGNDYANTVVTYDDPSYNAYNTIRGGGAGQTAGGIALAKADLGATLLNPTTALPDGRQYALHPAMTGLAGLFNSGKAAVQLNVGPLVAPTTLAQYKNTNRVDNPLPPNLFSHNDQQSVWQSSSPEGSTIGWGGNIGDLALSSNATSLFTCISVSGNAVFLSGDTALQYQIGTDNAVKINSVSNSVYGSSAVQNAIRHITQASSSQILENEYSAITKRSIAAEGVMTAALNTVPASAAPFNSFTAANPLSNQLRMVARIIASRNALSSKRQVFFVSMGGFDTHDNLISQHATLMSRVSGALTEFYNATVALGIADKVTTFTASDFGRTLSYNGDGSDHGWGNHHLMVGGAVRGQAFYGTAPPVSVGNTAAPNDQWHVGQGRLLPSTSVDQYAATLAKWFGVADNEMAGILPNLSRFGAAAGRPDYPVDLGFMA